MVIFDPSGRLDPKGSEQILKDRIFI